MDNVDLHYLFVCAANRNRSPTAAAVFRTLAAQAGFAVEVDSAGISPFSERPVTKELADRADLIFVMEDYMARELEIAFGQDPAKIVCLDIPDVYYRDDPLLVHLLKETLAPFVPRERAVK
ncbi:MAG: phosphotyrosine protein phosphatase [Planctomycetes bacterium]|nr:phosphotyrosine protein phosphatase [Planctomycetota bacterium]